MNAEDGDKLGPRVGLAAADRRALGIDDPRMNEVWRHYCIKQAIAIAHDVRIDPRQATHEGVRLAWLDQALRQNSQTFDTSVIVAELKETLDTGSALSAGSIYGLRSTAAQQSLWSAADRDYRDGSPSDQTVLLESMAMVSARLWMKSVAHFLPIEHIGGDTEQAGHQVVRQLPNPRCLVFHDQPLPLDIAVDGMSSVLAWMFVADGDGILDVTQVLMVSPDGRECLLVNGSVHSPALSPWASRIIPMLTGGQWTPKPKLKLPGLPAERTWRRALERKRVQEFATGSLDGVRLLSMPDK